MQIEEIIKTIPVAKSAARNEIVADAYDELLKLAARWMSDERQTHTLTTTALAHEVSLKLLHDERVPTEHRGQFLAYASKAMRHLLIDHARSKSRQKRGGDRCTFSLDEALTACDERPAELLAVNDAVERLGERRPRTARIVEMRYFAGMSVQEVARALKISVATVKRDWSLAKAWLRRELCRL